MQARASWTKSQRMRSLAFVLVTSLVLCACGGPAAGDKCEPEGGARCHDGDTALECKDGVFRSVACPGEKGCTQKDNQTTCDFAGAKDGDACFFADEGEAFCSPSDTHVAFKCEAGAFKLYPCANSCSQSDGQIFCQ